MTATACAAPSPAAQASLDHGGNCRREPVNRRTCRLRILYVADAAERQRALPEQSPASAGQKGAYDDFIRRGVAAIRGQHVQPIPGYVIAIFGVERMSAPPTSTVAWSRCSTPSSPPASSPTTAWSPASPCLGSPKTQWPGSRETLPVSPWIWPSIRRHPAQTAEVLCRAFTPGRIATVAIGLKDLRRRTTPSFSTAHPYLRPARAQQDLARQRWRTILLPRRGGRYGR